MIKPGYFALAIFLRCERPAPVRMNTRGSKYVYLHTFGEFDRAAALNPALGSAAGDTCRSVAAVVAPYRQIVRAPCAPGTYNRSEKHPFLLRQERV